MDALSPLHFLAQPRPDVNLPLDHADTTTLAAHDFDVDTRTGFMPPEPPLARLPSEWDEWEGCLADAICQRLHLAADPEISAEEMAMSDAWRARIRQLPILPTTNLLSSELLLRRAHHVLAWLIHFYIHTLPLDAPIVVPASLSVPQLQVCAQLQLPPVLTYSDDVLYNWALTSSSQHGLADDMPRIDNLRCVTLFTSLRDEQEFYLSSARIELRGVDALALMRATLDEAFVADSLALTRITTYLDSLSTVIADMTRLLLSVRDGCDPDVFYHKIRPWFKGEDSSESGRKWTFEGIAEWGLKPPAELSGPSAGQSAIVHALDIFLGVDQYSHAPHLTGRPTASSSPAPAPKASFLDRMQAYMPRHHRAFLRHLSALPPALQLRALVQSDPALLAAYNGAVRALKAFRDAHMRIVALYIVGPAAREKEKETGQRGRWLGDEAEAPALKGTGGTELVRFLKGVRDRTANAVMETREEIQVQAAGKVMQL